MAFTSGTLPVNGTSLYYEIRGLGPLLVLVPGTQGTATIFTSLASSLASRFRVVTYDRRGYYRSTLDPAAEKEIAQQAPDRVLQTHAHDLAALIVHHATPNEKAIVFGSSWATYIVFNLLALYPNLVAKAILHESIILSLFSGAKQDALRAMAEKHLLLHRQGRTGHALGLLTQNSSSADDQAEFRATEAYRRLHMEPINTGHWIDTESRGWVGLEVDLSSLRTHREKVVLINGSDQKVPELSLYPNRKLAELLDLPLFKMPGGHMGYATRKEFAVELAKILLGETPKL